MLRLALAILLCTASTSQAQPANQRAEAEAISFLKPCTQHSADDVKSCQENQWFFVESYMQAKAGVPIEMLRVSSYFGRRVTPDELDATLGIPEDPVQSCAWLIFNAARTSSYETFIRSALDPDTREICPTVPNHQYGAAFVRAGALSNEFNTNPLPPLPEGWHPHIPWIKTNPLPDLDSTVVPLTADPPPTH